MIQLDPICFKLVTFNIIVQEQQQQLSNSKDLGSKCPRSKSRSHESYDASYFGFALINVSFSDLDLGPAMLF